MEVTIFDWTKVAHRNDPKGMTVWFEINSYTRIAAIIIDTVGDNEPGWTFLMNDSTDARAIRGLAVKPVRNGDWPLVVRAIDINGCTADSTEIAVVKVQL